MRDRLCAAGIDAGPIGDVRTAKVAVIEWSDRTGVPLLKEARDLELVQVLSAGTDWIEDAMPPWATLCNARGSRDVPVAEWCVGALLGAATGLLHAAGSRRWENVPPVELGDWTVVSLG